MQVTQGDGNLSNHKFSLIFLEPTIFDQMSEQLTSFNEIHDEKNSVLVLENIVHTDYEWVVYCVENFFL